MRGNINKTSTTIPQFRSEKIEDYSKAGSAQIELSIKNIFLEKFSRKNLFFFIEPFIAYDKCAISEWWNIESRAKILCRMRRENVAWNQKLRLSFTAWRWLSTAEVSESARTTWTLQVARPRSTVYRKNTLGEFCSWRESVHEESQRSSFHKLVSWNLTSWIGFDSNLPKMR